MEWLQSGAQKLGFILTPQQIQKFCCYRDELLAWSRKVNLTAITEPSQIEMLHFLDSLTVALALPEPERAAGRICDVGSGAGFPGFPLKILFPGTTLALVDSAAKRTRFLSSLIGTLCLEDVEVHTGRCEDLGHNVAMRESFDVVVARAVASLGVLVEYTLPFCRVGGRAVFQKKGDIQVELSQAAHAWNELGGRLLEVKPVPEEVLGGQRVLVVVEKVSPTPDRYPRRAGVPAKRPL